MPSTRPDLAQHVATASVGAAAGRWDLLGLAPASRATGEGVQVLPGLPDQRYAPRDEVWDRLPDAPVDGAVR